MEWISIKERWPTERTHVLTVDKQGTCLVDYAFYLHERPDKTCISRLIWAKKSDRQQNSITHWMPLPEPPKEQI